MQTFLPDADFAESARLLDERRLGKQRSEALQVLRALVVPGYGWRHHPAAAMWRGYEEALATYGLTVCEEWTRRGHPDSCAAQISTALGWTPRSQAVLHGAGELPPWLGDERFHLSHRSALVRKLPGRYAPVFPEVAADLPYVWPASGRPGRLASPAPA
ncbi:MAG: MSMEG_6728 family protein [Candidatus Dormibacteria bacterium]